MEKLLVIKIGGKVIDDEQALKAFLKDFAKIEGKKVLVHGGGKIADRILTDMGIAPQMLNGRRVTNQETLEVVQMVYGGLINKNIVSGLQALSCNALGLSGADGNIILSKKRNSLPIDYGYVADIKEVNHTQLKKLIDGDIIPVLAPLTHDGKGQILNTNADTIASRVAQALGKHYEVNLVFGFEKSGVLKDQHDESTLIPRITFDEYQQYKEEGVISDGMIPKLDNAFHSINNGVAKVTICNFKAVKDVNTVAFKGSVLC